MMKLFKRPQDSAIESTGFTAGYSISRDSPNQDITEKVYHILRVSVMNLTSLFLVVISLMLINMILKNLYQVRENLKDFLMNLISYRNP